MLLKTYFISESAFNRSYVVAFERNHLRIAERDSNPIKFQRRKICKIGVKLSCNTAYDGVRLP